MIKAIKNYIKNNTFLFYSFFRITFVLRYEIPVKILGDTYFVKKKYKQRFGFFPDLNNPKRLTEKMQCIKLEDRRELCTLYADKLKVRDYFEKEFGGDGLVPIVFQTDDWRELKPENIPDYPCVIKANTGCGTYQFIMNKDDVNWNLLRAQARLWVSNNHYYKSQEWQYKNIKPAYLVEKVLICKNGCLPNDYKLHFINGEFVFIHCNVNADLNNKYKVVYDKNWEPVKFQWEKKKVSGTYERGEEIVKPRTFDEMLRIGKQIAKDFKYVRVDFYDVDGKLYYGEITMCHGSGMNKFIPDEYDFIYGAQLRL